MLFWLLLSVYSGSLKQICLAHPLSFECFTALKGTHFYILLVMCILQCDTLKTVLKMKENIGIIVLLTFSTCTFRQLLTFLSIAVHAMIFLLYMTLLLNTTVHYGN